MFKNTSKIFLTIIIPEILFLVGCSSTPRGLRHNANRPITQIEEKQQSVETNNFATQVSSLNEGSSLYFYRSPLGKDIQIIGDGIYTNALGQSCRKARAITEHEEVHFAVCKDLTNKWIYIAPLTSDSEF